jgi:hypothetical protein
MAGARDESRHAPAAVAEPERIQPTAA